MNYNINGRATPKPPINRGEEKVGSIRPCKTRKQSLHCRGTIEFFKIITPFSMRESADQKPLVVGGGDGARVKEKKGQGRDWTRDVEGRLHGTYQKSESGWDMNALFV